MNNFIKIAIGWTIWTVGSIMYTWGAHWTPSTTETGYNGPEFVYMSMAVAYFLGVPIITIAWVLHKKRPWE